ncbi:hypothetical protein ACFQRK_19665 [Parapedobacter sp. GCM10030251]|uniref:hypothetical protein n=1 Tax=Parapedobacter sp. GCM10030251 TaxID=3273419 RepID=UPI0036203B41
MEQFDRSTDVLIRHAGQGRTYDCGSMTAVFKADESETDEKYSISEWWLAPYAGGVGAHQHEDNEEVFYVLEGTVAVLINDKWKSAEKALKKICPASSNGLKKRIPSSALQKNQAAEFQSSAALAKADASNARVRARREFRI